MADTLHARDLVLEDARQSRGLVLDEELLIEQERELDDDLQGAEQRRRQRRNGSSSSSSSLTARGSPSELRDILHSGDAKGKARARTQDGADLNSQARSGLYSAPAMRSTSSSGSGIKSANGNAGTATSDTLYDAQFEVYQRDGRRRRASSGAAARGINTPDISPGYATRAEDEYDGPLPSSATTSRLLGDLLSRNPLKQLEDEDARGSPRDSARPITKYELRQAYWRNIAVSCLFVLAWYICSTLISLYNKWMFSPEHYNFGYPLFVTSCHMLVQFCLCSVVLGLFPSLRPKHRPNPHDYGTKAVPCGLATGLDIGLSNLSLKTITLSFYTMCKSSVLGFVLIWAFIFRLERPTLPLIGIISVITAGVIMMVSSQTQFHLVGMIQVLVASCLSGLRWALTQILLDKESMGMNNPFATLFWLAPIMGISLALCSIFVEGWFTIFASEFFDGFQRTLVTIGVIVFPGVIAFSMNVAEFGLIQRTSVVTLSVAGIFKEVATIFLSTVVFKDQLTPINISGLCVALLGIVLYNYLKYRKYKASEKKLLENGRLSDDAMLGRSGGEHEEEMALRPTTMQRDRDGGAQFQLVGEEDFESSDDDESGDESDRRRHTSAAGNIPSDRPPSYVENADSAAIRRNWRNTLKMEQEVNEDPMLVDIDREEEQLEREMAAATRKPLG